MTKDCLKLKENIKKDYMNNTTYKRLTGINNIDKLNLSSTKDNNKVKD